MSDYDRLAEQLRHPENPVVFMEITAGGAPIGTIKMELFADVCPKTAENFRLVIKVCSIFVTTGVDPYFVTC